MSEWMGRAGQAELDRRIGQRDDIEFILAMARHLSRSDRELIDYLFREGRTAADYARLSRRNIRTTQKRVNAILKRIYSPEFQYLLAHELVLPREYHATARRLFLEDQGLRATARLTGMTLHAVRRHRTEIAALLKAQTQAWKLPESSPARRRPAMGSL